MISLKHQTLLLAFILGFVGSAIFGGIRQAYPHDWYNGKQRQIGSGSCCGGDDCLQLDLEQVTEDADEFIITLYGWKSENPYAPRGMYPRGKQVYRFPKDKALPVEHWDHENPKETGYHVCIVGGKAVCFWYPTST